MTKEWVAVGVYLDANSFIFAVDGDHAKSKCIVPDAAGVDEILKVLV